MDKDKYETTSFTELFLKHNKDLFEYCDQVFSQKQKANIFNNIDISRKLFSYEKMIVSLHEKLDHLRKENKLLYERIQINNGIPSGSFRNEDSQQLKNLISIVKEEVQDLRKSLLYKSIQKLQHDIHVQKIHNEYICFLTELRDRRIVTCGNDNSISIVSIDYETKKWKVDIKKVNAHDDCINSLCELNNERLVSGSWDKTLKIWSITLKELKLLSKISGHTNTIWKVIPLTNDRFSSCSSDKTIMIWNSVSYELITSIKNDNIVLDLLKPEQKEILISSVNETSIDFLDLTNYKKLNSIKGHYSWCYGQKMIELPNKFIAISSCASGFPIIIVDPIIYSIIKEIKEEGYITNYSSLCVLNSHSFIYVYKNHVVQITIDNEYKVLYKTNEEQQLNGYYGLISVNKGEYLIVVNSSEIGFEVNKPCY